MPATTQIHGDHLSAAPAPLPVPPASNDRRRPGRRNDASPALIALMRKPTAAARIRVAVYDAPNFILQPDTRRGARVGMARLAVALASCSAVAAVAFKGMLAAWG